MKTHYMVKVELKLLGPILTAGGETSEPGIDAPMARDRNGRFMLPFSLVKGKFLDAVSELRPEQFEFRDARYFPVDETLIDWLGLPSADGDYDPERGRLRFGDFHTQQRGNPENVIERIKLDPAVGAVKNQMLVMIQAPFTYGEEVTFEGQIDFIADAGEAEEILTLINEALRWVPAYGAFRTVGFGRTKSVKTTLAKTPTRQSGQPAENSRLPFELSFDRPLCLVGRKHSQNHFESVETISGGVLKGALAQMIREVTGLTTSDISIGADAPGAEFAALRRHFSVIRVAEARPRAMDAAVRPVEPPLSIVRSPVTNEDDPPFFDAALETEASLVHGAAPAFRPDWKDGDSVTVRGAFGWSQLPRERRTRTAINPGTGRAADEQLFSYGLVLPDQTISGEPQQFVWDGCLGLEEVPAEDRAAVRQELQALLNCGIVGVGKTRAVAAVKWISNPPAPAVGTTNSHGKLVVIVLQTDCLMTNPETLLRRELDDPLDAAYREFWHEVSNGGLTLARFFARQSLYGGFVSHRAKQVSGGTYEPFLLTDRGSTFVLEAKESRDIEALVNTWTQQGLPTPAWCAQRYAVGGAPLWQRCPYIRENGYGEITANLSCHFNNRFPATATAHGVTS